MDTKDRIRSKKRAGVCVSLPSVLTANSFECGDIHSLYLLSDWATNSGMSIIQLLPLNDTGFGNSPYNSISAFAIDPVYISLHELGIPSYTRRKKITNHFIEKNRIRLLKLQVLHDYYIENIPKHEEQIEIFLKDFPFLKEYVCFKVLYEHHSGKDWKTWKENTFSTELLEKMKSTFHEEFYFQCFLQLIAYQQLKKAKEYAESKGVYIKGDMPILLSPNSADVWAHQNYFNLDLSSGAPPDHFSSEGQNWGFPVIDWKEMKKDGYAWWKNRLVYLQNFYHLYRIDHVIGMYRIWAMDKKEGLSKRGWFEPQIGIADSEFGKIGVSARELAEKGIIKKISEGRYIFLWDFYYFPEYNQFPEEIKKALYELSVSNLEKDEALWLESGEDILNVLESSTSMLPCAEDLGTVPGFVRDSLFKRKMIGIDVIRWTKNFQDGSFIPPESYREFAISVLSTHDTSLARYWWEKELLGNDKEIAKKFFEIGSEDGYIEKLIQFAYSTNSKFTINLLQDLLISDTLKLSGNYELHRINLPNTPEDQNWNYRFNFTLEDLIKEKSLSAKLRNFSKESNRV